MKQTATKIVVALYTIAAIGVLISTISRCEGWGERPNVYGPTHWPTTTEEHHDQSQVTRTTTRF